MELDVRLTIGLVIFDSTRGKYLILRRNPERYRGWGLIKGGIDCGETPQQACVRETLEEIGISLDEKMLRDLEHRSAYYDNTHSMVVMVEWFVVECEKLSNLKLEDAEWVDHRWTTYEEALYELVWQTQQRALRIAQMLLTQNEKPLEAEDGE
jgi:8-oxo-dGTP pyrophosphatase MutT (NUDIX family)